MDLLKANDRAIVMAPSATRLKKFEEFISKAQLPHKVLHAPDIEDNLTVFTESKKAILGVAGRYDGIDLPDDSCRLAIVFGLPATVSLQEEFLWSKLRLTKVLKDRIRTRIVQGCGRCTRNATDYAVIILAGATLLDFMSQTGVQALLHPELRAEVKFGLENSDNFETAKDLTELCRMFLDQGDDWAEAEQNIIQLRSEIKVERPGYMKMLQNAASSEVRYQYMLWSGAYESAFEAATEVVDGLSGDELGGYRCLWNYLAGCAAHLSISSSRGKRDPKMQKHALERFKRASQSVMTLPWFARLKYDGVDVASTDTIGSKLTGVLIQNIDETLLDMQYVGKKFAKRTETFQTSISTDDPNSFEPALTELGLLLGYKAWKPSGQGEPDSVWSLENQIFFLLEAKSDESAGDPVSISTCRQAQGHEKWLRQQPMMPGNAEVFTVVISPRRYLGKEAVPHADALFFMSMAEVRALANETIASLRATRSKASDLDVEDRLGVIVDMITSNGLTHEGILGRLTRQRLKQLKTR